MFEFNKDAKVEVEEIEGSKIYSISNFYKDPDSILEFFLSHEPPLWKKEETPSYNGIFFEDRRHHYHAYEMIAIHQFLANLCGQKPLDKMSIKTNQCRFKNDPYNDFDNHYWCPHIDAGYNGIVYFNKNDDKNGTNLYRFLDIIPKQPDFIPEHFAPWHKKINYEVVKYLKSEYNKLYLFDGKKFLHGMNVSNKRYFGSNYRINQVFFFVQDNFKTVH